MSFRYSSCFSLSSPNMRSVSTSEKPMMAFSGVRSSCDMLARNSDLWRLAASSWALLSAISRKSRAFWMARADWVANVFRTSTTSGGNSPAAFRLKDKRSEEHTSELQSLTNLVCRLLLEKKNKQENHHR